MSDTDFDDARSIAHRDFAGRFAEKNGVVSASVCQSHDYGADSLSVAFDHAGHVWVCLVRNYTRLDYGNPDPVMKMRHKQ